MEILVEHRPGSVRVIVQGPKDSAQLMRVLALLRADTAQLNQQLRAFQRRPKERPSRPRFSPPGESTALVRALAKLPSRVFQRRHKAPSSAPLGLFSFPRPEKTGRFLLNCLSFPNPALNPPCPF